MIEVRDLHKHYGATRSLDGVSFSVGEGEILGFLGPNGAGKTTTMRILTGLARATKGEARVGGFDVRREHLAVRSILGFLPEDAPHYPEMRVDSFLRFMAGLKGIPRRRIAVEVDRVLEETDTLRFRGRILGNLSKGMRQRAGIAQALLGDPKVLVLDEPTTGLDPSQVSEVRQLIARMRGRRTVIFSTHILPYVAETCTRVAILHKGRLIAEGPTAEVTRRFSPRRIIALVRGDGAKAKELLAGVLGEAASAIATRTTPEGVEVRASFSGEADHRAACVRALVDGGLELVELYEDQPGLEEVFLAATGGAP